MTEKGFGAMVDMIPFVLWQDAAAAQALARGRFQLEGASGIPGSRTTVTHAALGIEWS